MGPGGFEDGLVLLGVKVVCSWGQGCGRSRVKRAWEGLLVMLEGDAMISLSLHSTRPEPSCPSLPLTSANVGRDARHEVLGDALCKYLLSRRGVHVVHELEESLALDVLAAEIDLGVIKGKDYLTELKLLYKEGF